MPLTPTYSLQTNSLWKRSSRSREAERSLLTCSVSWQFEIRRATSLRRAIVCEAMFLQNKTQGRVTKGYEVQLIKSVTFAKTLFEIPNVSCIEKWNHCSTWAAVGPAGPMEGSACLLTHRCRCWSGLCPVWCESDAERKHWLPAHQFPSLSVPLF